MAGCVAAVVWERLPMIVGGEMDPTSLRSAVIQAGHTACAFDDARVLSVLRGLLWSLVDGDLYTSTKAL